MDIVLASNSPHKKSLMNKLGLIFTMQDPGISDDIVKEKSENPQAFVERIALEKAVSVAKDNKSSYVIGHHMIVVKDGVIMNRPKDREEAIDVLANLNGQTHNVIGILVLVQNRKIVYKGVQSTIVEFKNLSKKEIEDHAASEEPLEKAGGYAVQGQGGMFIKSINGSYFNMAGFPLTMVVKALEKNGFEIADEVKQTITLQEKSIKESFPR